VHQDWQEQHNNLKHEHEYHKEQWHKKEYDLCSELKEKDESHAYLKEHFTNALRQREDMLED